MTIQDCSPLAQGDSPGCAFDARLDGRSPDDLRETFSRHAASRDPRLVRQGLRPFSASLMAQGLVGMQEYASLFGGHAIHHLTVDGAGSFVHAGDGTCARTLVHAYSRAKYGSIDDIRLLAGMVSARLSEALDDPDNPWRCMFERAGADGDQVVMLTTGWRNVPSTANVLFDLVVERVNVKLAYLGLPTLIGIKLPRIAPACENYASLDQEERERISVLHDHVLPAPDFYRSPGVHVVFGDDVLVTGATADKVYASALTNGAKSFMAIYPVLLDPVVALRDPSVEERLNTTMVSGRLDNAFASVLSSSSFVPILRSLRTLLDSGQESELRQFLPGVPVHNLLRLYVSALNNEFLRDQHAVPSLMLLRTHLVAAGVLDAAGFPMEPA